MIQEEKIHLRVVTHADLALLNAWVNDPQVYGEYGSFGLRAADTYERRFAEDGLLSTRFGQLLIVTRDDTPIGSVSYHQVGYGPNEGSKAYNIGISIVAEHRGKGYGVEAQRLLAAYLFAAYPIMRVEAVTDIENIPEQRALRAKVSYARHNGALVGGMTRSYIVSCAGSRYQCCTM